MFMMQVGVQLQKPSESSKERNDLLDLKNLLPPKFEASVGAGQSYIGANFYHGLKISEDDNTTFHIKGAGSQGVPSTVYDSDRSQIVSNVRVFAMEVDLGKKASQLKAGDKINIAGTAWEVFEAKANGKFIELGHEGNTITLEDNKRINLASESNQILKNWYVSIANPPTEKALGIETQASGDSILLYNYEMFENTNFLGGESINVPFFGAHVSYDGLVNNQKLNVLFGDTGTMELITSPDGSTRGDTISGNFLTLFCEKERLNVSEGVFVRQAYAVLDKNKIYAKAAGDSYPREFSLNTIGLTDAAGVVQKINLSKEGVEIWELSRHDPKPNTNAEDYTDLSFLPIYEAEGQYRFKESDSQPGYIYNQSTHFEDLEAHTPPMTTTRGSVWNSVGTTAASLSFSDQIAKAQFSLNVDGVTSVSQQALSHSAFNSASLFPNPATNQITLRLDLAAAEPATLRVYNGVGQEVLANQRILGSGPKEIQLDVSSLASDTYYLNIHDNSGNSMTMPFVVQK